MPDDTPDQPRQLVHVRFDRDLHDALKAYAKRTKRTVNAAVEHLVETGIEAEAGIEAETGKR